MPSLSKLKKNLQTEANRLGFPYLGIAPAHPAPHYQTFSAWLDQGFHGEMTYLSRPDALQKRRDPGLIVPECQRVISLAVPYHPPVSPLDGTVRPGKGRISAYARMEDYHHLIWERLPLLEKFLKQNAGRPVRTKSYVDTGPILEKPFASRAGLGAQGKNTCLIIPGVGSYVFLAEILTDLPLPVDPPLEQDLCKSCTRCLDACPTGCIQTDRTIDAQRCISYLTIENKGAIPEALRPDIGAWFFGCDVCQMVCPHNARAREKISVPPQLTPKLPEWLPLTDLILHPEAALTGDLAQTPLTRAKCRGLLRNAAIVLGNQKCSPALPALQTALERETDPLLISLFQWTIETIQ